MHPFTHSLQFRGRALMVLLAVSLAACQPPALPSIPPSALPVTDTAPPPEPTPTQKVATPAATPTATPVPLPAAVKPETTLGLMDVADLGMTQFRITQLLRGTEAEAVLPPEVVDYFSEEDKEWVFVRVEFDSGCASADAQHHPGGLPVDENCWLPNVGLTLADTDGRAFRAAHFLDADNQWPGYEGTGRPLFLDRENATGFAVLVDPEIEIWRVTLDDVYFDPELAAQTHLGVFNHYRDVVFTLGESTIPAVPEAPLPLTARGRDATDPGAIGDTIVTANWRARLMSIETDAEAWATFRALNLPVQDPKVINYLATVELTSQADSWMPVNLPEFEVALEGAEKPLSLTTWTREGKAEYDQRYYPGASLTVYLTRFVRPEQTPLQIIGHYNPVSFPHDSPNKDAPFYWSVLPTNQP